MKKSLTLFFALLLTSFAAVAQMFTVSPLPVQESSANVVITFHADRSGVAALTGLPSSTPLYAHLGVYTTKSPSDWCHVQTDWSQDLASYQYSYVSANTYQLTLSGDLRSYFQITDPDEHITKICVIARTAKGTAQTSDQFIDVADAGFNVGLEHSLSNLLITSAANVSFTGGATENCKLVLDVNGTVIKEVASGKSLSASYNISSNGTYTFTLTGTKADGTVKNKKVTVSYPDASPSKPYPGGVPKMGAVKNSDGSVTFCLAAPGKSSVIIVGAWDDFDTLDKNTMYYHDYNGQRYFWITVNGLDNTTAYPYYYLVDNSIKVGDPYAHLVLNPTYDRYISKDVFPDRPSYPVSKVGNTMLAVYQGNLDDYAWKVNNFNIPSHESLNVYELLFRDFTGTDGKDDGTVRKAIEKIPYLKALGVNAVELMPIMEFNGNNSWGYNTNFYMAPDKSYGTPDDYKEFIDKCHENGMAVILDIVFNQSDGHHPWYKMYSIDENPFYNKNAPHDYSVLNDWKQEHPLVQQQWEDALRYWMTVYKVDGFRFDLVKGLGTEYPSGTEAYNSSRVQVMKRLHNAIKSVNPKGIHINENLAGAQEENEMGADGQLNWSNLNNASCQYAMGYASGCNLNVFYAPKNGRTIGTTVAYAESHDEERMGYKQTKWGVSAVKNNEDVAMMRLSSVAAQMLMTPGAKMVWQFGELGADQTTKTSTGGNDTSPKKVVWNYLDNEYRKGLHDTYADLMGIRLVNPELFGNSAECTHVGFSNDSNPRSIRLNYGSKELVVLLNPSVSSEATVSCDVKNLNSSNYRVVSKTYGTNPSVSFSGGKISASVPAHCYVVVTTNNVSGEESVFDSFDNAPMVTTDGGRIVIAGDYRMAEVYNMSGARFDIHRTLPAGVYIVNVDGRASKVVVR